MFLTHALRAIYRAAVVTGDSLWKYVSLLVSGNPPTQTFISDTSTNSNVITINGDTRPTNFGPYTPGYYSNYFDGTGDYLNYTGGTTTTLSGDYTFECWVYLNNLSASQPMICIGDDFNLGLGFFINASGKIALYGNAASIYTSTGSTVVVNTWTHIAVVRSGSTITGYINGIAQSTAANSFQYSGTTTYIGRETYNTGYATSYSGYISNLRLVKGTAVYTAAFTPPTAPLTAIANTSLLTCQSNRFIDNSANNFAITKNGDTTISGFDPFVPDSSTSTYGSTYFDGTGDNLSIANNAAFNFGTSAFTVEAWVYFSSVSAAQAIITNYGSSTTGWAIQISGGVYIVNLSGDGADITGSAAVANTWTHVAVSGSSGSIKLFVNGTQQGSTFTGAVALDTSAALTIGSLLALNYVTGYISNVRIVKGTAVYTANFTPPTAPLTAITNTSLLTCQTNQPVNNSMFVDSSSLNNLITRTGNATQGTFSPYGANWSNYFASGNYLSYAMSQAFTTTTNFCVEAWLYPLSTTANEYYWFESIQPGLFFDSSILSNNTIFIRIGASTGSTLTTTGTVTINTWNHVAITYDGTTLRAFINGVAAGSVAFTMFTATNTQCMIGYNNYAPAARYFDGYISNWRMSVGTARYTTAFTPSTTPFVPDTYTVLLAAQSPNFVDTSYKANVGTITGTPSVQRFSPFSPAIQTPISYSTYFDGTGDYLTATGSTAFTLGTGDFTIECWFYTAVGTNNAMFQLSNTAGGFNTTYTNTIAIGLLSGKINLYGVAGTGITSTGSSYATSTWTHVALVRSSGVTKLYINGALDTTVGTAGSITDTTNYTMQYIVVGGYYSTAYLWNGYVSNLRVVKGTAVYTAAFTPPTAPLTAISGTSLLTCQSATIVDNSSNAFAITTTGDARARTQNPFGFTNTTTNTAYTPALYGGSAYFDGTGDTLNLPASAALPGAGDFTIDFWVNLPAAPTGGAYFTAFAWGSTGSVLRCFIFDATGTKFGIWIGATQIVNVATTAMISQWAHIGMSRKGTSFTFYINGVLIATVTDSTNYNTGTLYVASQAGASYLAGYISDFRIIVGTALYTGGFAPPVAPVQAVQNTVLLLNMDKGAAIDSSRSNDLETVGDAKVTYETPYAGSYYSNYFDGTGDYLNYTGGTTTTLSGDYTFECWVYLNNLSASQPMICIGDDFNLGLGFFINTSGKITLYGNAASIYTSTGSTVVVNTWTHIAVVRSGSTITGYINGIAQSTATNSSQYSGTTTYIGRETYNTGYATSYSGYISNLRLVKGTAVYTANFTPPTAPLTAISGTSLLTCQSKSFVDNSSNAFAITRNGDTAVRSFNPFQKNTYSSTYFDGTGDYIIAPLSTKNAFGTGNFTAEMWLYPTAFASYKSLWGCSSGAASSTGFHTGLNASGNVFIYSASAFKVTTTNAMNLNAWNHVAFVRSGTALNIYINGVLGGTWALTTQTFTDGYCWFGAAPGYASEYYTGYLADWRITNSQARYTATFTPPTAPLPTA